MSDLYMMIIQCLESAPYAGKEFEAKAYQWLEDSEAISQEEREEGWQKMYDEYLLLSEPYWEAFWKRIEVRNQKLAEKQIVQRELFA